GKFVVTVTVNDGQGGSDSETFQVTVNASTGSSISVVGVSQSEGDDGFVNFVFDVNLSASSAQTVTVNYATADDTARALQVERIAAGLSNPLFVTAPPADSNRLFIVEQGSSGTAQIRILNRATGQVNATPFLTLSGIGTGGERGLLGLVFHPDYASNGFFFVNFTDAAGTTTIRRYQVSANPDVANAGAFKTILTIPQPFSNHNGGWMDFGPDGYLYISSGDGGSGNDPNNAGQQLNTLLGKMLRIDVDVPDPQAYAIPSTNPFANDGDPNTLGEIWAFGLRNPWRSSFDALTGDLYIADVGQSAREEINVQLASSTGGENYGWRLREGTIATPSVGGAKPVGAIDPIYDYLHGTGPTQGNSVTGGYVYRGPIAELNGNYFFADFVRSRVWSLRFDGSAPTSHNGTNYSNFIDWTSLLVPNVGSISSIASFGQTSNGDLFIVDYGGEIFQLTNGGDYLPTSGVLTFTPGETTKTITVQVHRDQLPESNEQFLVVLSNAVNATLAQSQAAGVIQNDD
ncbi:MAG: PQQ-dependent sugar dehydrogenase, partial [Phycisphaeraceae bacterium]